MHTDPHRKGRLIASVAATALALACGTNYVYSAWAPQFAERLKLSATESNLIGLFGNLGMYSMGFPIGIFIDNKGPRPAVLGGVLLLAAGYFPLHQAYDNGSGSVVLLCLFSYLSGLGGCMAFSAAVKVSALNWPEHRGTATAFPLAAFGLSAFFFSLLGSLLFPGDPSGFLLLLSVGTSGLTLAAFFFLKVYSPASNNASASYEAVPVSEDADIPSELMTRASLEEAKQRRAAPNSTNEPGTLSGSPQAADHAHYPSNSPPTQSSPGASRTVARVDTDEPSTITDESTPLVSADPPPPLTTEQDVGSNVDKGHSHSADLRGFALLRTVQFWQFFAIMAVLAGIGIMTINNIGNNAKALWLHRDPDKDEEFLVGRQQMHVSILSVCSFLGRLSSGMGSDFLVKVLRVSRVWCLVLACLIFLMAQICALNIENPDLLWLVSALSGLGYGFLFGVYPSIVAETFGIRGLSQNWGWMTLSPVLSSNAFNIFYGTVYDEHSVVEPNGERACDLGLECYKSAYWATFFACFAGIAVTLWTIRDQHRHHAKQVVKADEED